MQSTDDFYKRLIKPIRDDVVSQIISSVESDVYSPYDQHLNWAERVVPIKQLKEQFIKWSDSLITGLDKFPHVYIMNGNTDSLNRLFNSSDTVAWMKGDYSYYSHWHKTSGKKYKELSEPESVDDIVFSWPGYTNGDDAELKFAQSCNATRLHLDCAYLALTKPATKVDVGEFETASFSFSKTLSIPYNRISILFSKKELNDISLLNRLGYVNLSGVKLATEIMKKIPVTYWWEKYGQRLQDLCKVNSLTPTNCILFAYEGSIRVGLAPYWKKHV
jgi:hypothetical protein